MVMRLNITDNMRHGFKHHIAALNWTLPLYRSQPLAQQTYDDLSIGKDDERSVRLMMAPAGVGTTAPEGLAATREGPASRPIPRMWPVAQRRLRSNS